MGSSATGSKKIRAPVRLEMASSDRDPADDAAGVREPVSLEHVVRIALGHREESFRRRGSMLKSTSAEKKLPKLETWIQVVTIRQITGHN
jgi:hypothetical protein